jgi:hypothetical protein
MAPKKKAVKKAPSVGLRGKRSVPPAAGLRPKKVKPLILEVGKTYETRAGVLAIITERTGLGEQWECAGEIISGKTKWDGFGAMWALDGRWGSSETVRDIVREVVKRRGK